MRSIRTRPTISCHLTPLGLAAGFILGDTISKVVAAVVTDAINPIIGIVLVAAEELQTATLAIGPAAILLGHFISVEIDFLVIAHG